MSQPESARRPGGPPGGAAALLLAVAAFVLLACQRGTERPSERVSAGPDDRPFYAGTPEMQAQIRSLIGQIPHTRGGARIELGRRIAAFGEPAVPLLVEALSSPDPDTRGTAAWLLGFRQDPRTIAPLVGALEDPDALVAYEAATSLLKLGDRRGLARVVQGLEDRDPRVRAKCLDVLEQRTGETFGYRPDDPPSERAAAVARWRAWAASLSRPRR